MVQEKRSRRGAQRPSTPAGTGRRRISPPAFPFLGRKSILTSAELAFYNVLKDAVAGRFLILLKVGILDLSDIGNREVNQGAFKRVSAERVDFVLCDPATLAPLIAIELDDSTQYSRQRAERDRSVNEVLRLVGVGLIRPRVQVDVAALARWIDAAMPRRSGSTPLPNTPKRPATS